MLFDTGSARAIATECPVHALPRRELGSEVTIHEVGLLRVPWRTGIVIEKSQWVQSRGVQ